MSNWAKKTPEQRRAFYKKNKEKILKRQRERYRAASDHFKATVRLCRYGLTPEAYNEIRAKQLFCCAICQKPEAETGRGFLVVDHNHTTKEVRGLLCDPCNTMLGNEEKKPGIFIAALQYLHR